jgi:hypothetical protein
MMVEVFRSESWRESSDEGSEFLAIIQPLTAAGTPEFELRRRS